MKFKLFYFNFFITVFFITFSETYCNLSKFSKKNITILSCRGGGAHTSAASAITDYLKDQYNVKTVNILDDILGRLDIVQLLSFNSHTGDDFYNYLISNQYVRSINFICWLAENFLAYWPCNWLIKKAFINYFSKNKSDLIVSVIPLFNTMLLGAAKKLNIPVIIVPVDLDSRHYILSKDNLDYSNYHYCLSFDNKDIKNQVSFYDYIPKKSIKITGFPLRSSFLESKLSQQVKRKFSIPDNKRDNKKVIMILMGGAGSVACYNYTKAIVKNVKCKLHVIVCLGRSEDLKHKISKIKCPSNITLSIVGFTDKIAELMVLSDLIITAPGPTSIVEALYSQKPILMDTTAGILNLHKFNVGFVSKHNLGLSLSDYKDLPKLINKLCCKSYCYNFKKYIEKFNKPNSKNNLTKLIDNILR